MGSIVDIRLCVTEKYSKTSMTRCLGDYFYMSLRVIQTCKYAQPACIWVQTGKNRSIELDGVLELSRLELSVLDITMSI